MYKLLGIGKLTSKAGKLFTIFHVSSPFAQRDLLKGCVGDKVEAIFLPDELVAFVDYSMVGKDIELDFEVNNGKAYLCGFKLAATSSAAAADANKNK